LRKSFILILKKTSTINNLIINRKTVDLYKEKIAKLSIEKENLENIDSAKNPNAKEDNLEMEKIKEQIMMQVNEKVFIEV
jgi:hypothetical protein